MNIQREKQILELLLKEKRVTVRQLAGQLFASEPSIRRDLVSLEQQHLIKRIHAATAGFPQILKSPCASKEIRFPK